MKNQRWPSTCHRVTLSPCHLVIRVLAGSGLGLLSAAPGPLPPPLPGQLHPPGLAPPPLLPSVPAPPLPTDPQLRTALASLNDLDALVAESRHAGEGTSVTPQQFDELTREIGARRATIQRLAEQVRAGGDEEGARTARAVIRWVSQASQPLHLARLARLRADTERLRVATEQEYTRLEERIAEEDRFPGEVAFTRLQARAYWDDGNIVAAAATFQRLQVLIAAALQETAERQEARQARQAATTLQDQAAFLEADRFAATSQRRALDLAAAAESAFAQGDYRAARAGWNQAGVCFDHAADLAAPQVRLARARDHYDAVSLGLTAQDLTCQGSDGGQLAHCLDNAQDEGKEPAARTASYEQATRLLLPLHLRAARALREHQPDAALDHLAAVLSAVPDDAEARTLFNALADRPGWWLARARAESFHVSDSYHRLPLYALLARSRRLTGDLAGAALARTAGIALVSQQTAEAWVPPLVFELLSECVDAGDVPSCRALLGAAQEAAPPATDPWRRALWLARLAGFATRAGESQVAETLVGEASVLLPGYGPWLEALAASAGGRHAVALQHWRELARLAKEPGKRVSRRTVVDLGGRVLEAAAEAREEETARTLRAELLVAAEKEDADTKARLRCRLVLADAHLGQWDAGTADSSVYKTPEWTRGLALARARQGEVGAAVDLLETAVDSEAAVACWHVAAACAAWSQLDRADLLAWMETLPNAEARCAAFLGAATRISGPRPDAPASGGASGAASARQ